MRNDLLSPSVAHSSTDVSPLLTAEEGLRRAFLEFDESLRDDFATQLLLELCERPPAEQSQDPTEELRVNEEEDDDGRHSL